MLKIGLFRNLTNSGSSLSISMSVVVILEIRLSRKELVLTCNMEMKSSASSVMTLLNICRKHLQMSKRLCEPPNQSRACVKSPEVNFGNDQICDMADFNEKSRWIGWSKNEFSHSQIGRAHV